MSLQAMFAVRGLDVKTVALVRLALAAFSKIDSREVIGIEASLKLGDGRRYNAFGLSPENMGLAINQLR